MQQKITEEYVKNMNKPSEHLMCSLRDNKFNIQFLSFRIRDVDTGSVIFEVKRDDAELLQEQMLQQQLEQQQLQDNNNSQEQQQNSNIQNKEINIDTPQSNNIQNEDYDDPEYRTVRYHFGPNFFQLKNIGTLLEFSVGDQPIKNFTMIERHYFKDRLIKSFEFKFPFCMPNTVNNWESIYELPAVAKELQSQMIDNPWETRSDSFYFVNGELIIHNKAEYNYEPFQEGISGDDSEENE